MVLAIACIVLFALLLIFGIAGVIWFFIQEDQRARKYIEFVNNLEQ